MPSPLAHTAAGFAVYSLLKSRSSFRTLKPLGRIPGLLSITTAFSLLPDLDSVAGFLTGNFGRFHNNGTHSFLIGILAALGFSGWARWKGHGRFRDWFLVSFVCYSLHVIMDSATISRGVMAFWPLSSSRWLAPVTLFYGFHWSDGWISWRHLWTLVTELAFAIPLIALSQLVQQRQALKETN